MRRRSAILVATLLLSAGVGADDEPYLIDEREFRDRFRTIALAPVDADPYLQMPESVAAIIEEEVTRRFERRGYTVIPSSVVAGIREKMAAQVGGLTDPESGQAQPEKVNAVRKHAFRELWYRNELDAVATIRVSITRVPVESDRVEWDGVRQRIEADGRRTKYTATIAVSSVSVSVYDPSDRLMYSKYGGLEALMRREDTQLVPVAPEQFFSDEDRIREAAEEAVSDI